MCSAIDTLDCDRAERTRAILTGSAKVFLRCEDKIHGNINEGVRGAFSSAMDSTNNATAPMATVSAVPATAMDLPTPRKRARSPDGGGQGRGKSRSRGARGGHNKRSDMGRAEWR